MSFSQRTGIGGILLFLMASAIGAQSPHGESLRISCDACHTSASWVVDPAGISFDHDSTRFALQGQHTQIDCRSCHTSLVFSLAPMDCASCHTDVHQGSVGFDCARCHDPSSWLVNTITEMHEAIGFPLLGVHAVANCFECHVTETDLRFDPIGLECINCHRPDFEATTNPNHTAAGFSTNCQECHNIHLSGWAATGIDHSFFPLTLGHEINDCARCHTGPDFASTPTDCFACHQPDYEMAMEPNHIAAHLPTNCVSCHTTHPDWEPAQYADHDPLYFPIYSGTHEDVWSQCAECHENSGNYAEFTCTTCHINPETDEHHASVMGYTYSSPACLACHPTGDAEDVFDHDKTNFPLTGVHAITDCIHCHFEVYAGTPAECVACHDKDYEQSVNPSHTQLVLSTDCATCHTTDPEWNPALFPDHDNYYALAGAHALIAMECVLCHNGDYINTPNTCVGCHLDDYNATTDPAHATAQFSTDCATCHNEMAWRPATIDHDMQFFPIYSGVHAGEWDQCLDCHTNINNYAEYTCITCHINPETDEAHVSVGGYSYNSTACLACHPTGNADDVFDHNLTAFPLTGAHLTTDCLSCHAGGFAGTPTECAACHLTDFEQTSNPNHMAIGINTECAVCHTTLPGWSPAAFPDHDAYYVIAGAHTLIAMECVLCHNNDYNNTPNTCVGCHLADYSATTDPDHTASQYPTECIICHNESAWQPSIFDHALTDFPLTGAHVTVDCASCHAAGYTGTPTDCAACHLTDFEQTTNPNHTAIGLSNDCAMCHTTAPEWSPAGFPEHDDYDVLAGAHALVAMECVLCHNGDYNNTPNTCVGCHLADYNATMNPSHVAAQFSTDCATCHGEIAWVPSTFDHDVQYFPIYSGAHEGTWSQCLDCHINPTNFAEVTCITCHANPETDDQHAGVNGYVYQTQACLGCHPTGDADVIFDHNMTAFPLTGAHLTVECLSCHAGGFAGTPTECAACHLTDFEQTTNPNHIALGLSTDCIMCHTTDPDWNPAAFPNHNDYYVFAGAHIPIAMECILCHNGDYNNTPNTCVGCHLDDYNQTTDPNHTASQFPTNCAVCHSESAWSPADFDHDITDFPLTGAHVPLGCAACHAGGYTGTSTDCAACHINDYNQSSNPLHIALGLPTDCALCHTTDPDWNPAGFPDHNDYYVLEGAHVAIAMECVLCHNGDYINTPNTCIGCHLADFNETTDPNHVALQFPTECLLCHNQTAWIPATFDHDLTDFPLTGAHIPLDCISCHGGGYTGTPTDCAACHLDDYNQSSNPPHIALGLPTDCALCHTTDPDWNPAGFPDHNSYYVLEGAHALIAMECVLCHNGDYNNTPNTCVGCHLDDYNATTDPDHVATQFPTDCILCHSQSAWVPATFDHDLSDFPLTGAHIPLDCIACHAGGYTGTPTDCAACHLDDYNQSINPGHLALGLSTDCVICHTTNPDWNPAGFPEHNNYYALIGAHAFIADECVLCHNGDYNNTPNTCFGCHQADYNQTNNPNHQAAQFPTDCILCHNENAWIPAMFDHDGMYFPIYDGRHEDEWDQCIDCHVDPNNYMVFSCFGCHPQGEMDDRHDEVNGYIYESNACLACHPDGED